MEAALCAPDAGRFRPFNDFGSLCVIPNDLEVQMDTWHDAAVSSGPLPIAVNPSHGDRPCIESAEDAWPLRLGIILVMAIALSIGLGLFGFAA
jgi:hypothetical protein